VSKIQDLINKTVEKFKKHSNIQFVYEDHLCNFCGACFLVCPVDAITYKNGCFSINSSCISCKKCVEVCSQNQESRYKNHSALLSDNQEIKILDKKMKNVPFGKFQAYLITQAKKEEIMNHAMTGGTATALLLFLLEKEIVDSVLAIDFEEIGIFPSAKFISTEKELTKAAGSKYLPTFSLAKLRELEENNEKQKVALIVLPCQAYAINKLKKIDEFKKINNKIEFVISLFCGNGLPNKQEVEMFLAKKNFQIEGDEEISAKRIKEDKKGIINPMNKNRYVYTKTHSKYSKSFSSRKIFKSKGKTNCSRICPDYTGYYSDLSIGAVGFKTNIIVARNEKATRIVQRAIKEGYLVQKKKPSLFNYLAIKIMGDKKREKIADVFYKLFIG